MFRPILLLAWPLVSCSQTTTPPTAPAPAPTHSSVNIAEPSVTAEQPAPTTPTPLDQTSDKEWSPPRLSEQADAGGAQPYVDSPTYTLENVPGLGPGRVSPEAAVVHYLASRIRKDGLFAEVLSTDCSERCAQKRSAHERWQFTAFRLEKRKDSGKLVSITVWMSISVDGREGSGSDQFELIEEADGWRIAMLPT